MRYSLAILVLLVLVIDARAYTDGDGVYRGENSGCDIFREGKQCPQQEVYITAYGRRMKASEYVPPSGGARNYCASIPGIAASNVLMETCMKMEREAGQRIGR